MKLKAGNYELSFLNGGVEIQKEGTLLYFNKRPIAVTIKTREAVSEFYDCAYETVSCEQDKIFAGGTLQLTSGSAYAFIDCYETADAGFRISRRVEVLKAGDELGFSSKLSLFMAATEDPAEYECFAPGCWYRHNEFAPDRVIGKDLDCEYFWFWETRCALPLFSMYHSKSGETAAISRWAADVGLRNLDINQSESNVDSQFSIGSIGMSRPKNRTLNYMYYGYEITRENPHTEEPQGLSIDYVYPGAEGQTPIVNHYGGLDFKNKAMSFSRINHPVEPGFVQEYSVAVQFAQYESYHKMLADTWRTVYDRMRDDLFEVDNEKFFHDSMNIFIQFTKQYGESYGLPFACQLPNMDVSSVSFQFGFVGQQPGIGYLLMRYGIQENHPEALEKGMGILNFWTKYGMTEQGLPQMCYHPGMRGFEPYPYYTRMLADGMEAILDAYVYLHKRGTEKQEWLEFCVKVADWLTAHQNEDGSYYRAYYVDGSIRMDSRSNTPSAIRFLVQMYLVTGNETYKAAAVKAGEWCLENICPTLEYRGGTCDNSDIQDKEAGIYGIFGFLSLYDLTEEDRWLKALKEAADYTETWTYAWNFPVKTTRPVHPFNQYGISGQSVITIFGGADVYMASCAYVYYRLYLITEDPHYLDFAEFIYKNTRQSNDVEGKTGYCLPAIGHESGNFAGQLLQSHYHWLPWCTFVEAEPTARLFDTFGAYEIADIQKLSMEERKEKNRIYKYYWTV